MTLLSDPEEDWPKVSGDNADMDILILVEVFAEWCGPTAAVVTLMKKLKQECADEPAPHITHTWPTRREYVDTRETKPATC